MLSDLVKSIGPSVHRSIGLGAGGWGLGARGWALAGMLSGVIGTHANAQANGCLKTYRLIRLCEVPNPDVCGIPEGNDAVYGADNTFGINDQGQLVGTMRWITPTESTCGSISHQLPDGSYERLFAFLWLPRAAMGIPVAGNDGCSDAVLGTLVTSWSGSDILRPAFAPSGTTCACGSAGLFAPPDAPWDVEGALAALGFASVASFAEWVQSAEETNVEGIVLYLQQFIAAQDPQF